MLSSLLVPIAQGELCIISESYLFTTLFDILENKMQNVHRLTCSVNKSSFPKKLGTAEKDMLQGPHVYGGLHMGSPGTLLASWLHFSSLSA